MFKRVITTLMISVLCVSAPAGHIMAATISEERKGLEVEDPDFSDNVNEQTDIIDSSDNIDSSYETSEPTYSGTCGEALTWSIDYSGILTISGVGEMTSASWNTIPNFKRYIKGVILNEGLTSICEAAFAECDEIMEVIIPDGVISIGRGAFYHCNNLSHIVIPESLVSFPHESGSSPKPEIDGVFDSAKLISAGPIGGGYNIEYGWKDEIPAYAFRRCHSGLKTIEFPEGLRIIGAYAFYECDNLEEIIIPDTVTTLGETCFYGCDRVKHIVVPGSVTSVQNNLVFGSYDSIKTIGPIGGNYDFEYGWEDSIPVNGLRVNNPDYVLISGKINKCASPPTNIMGGLWNYKLKTVGPKGGGYNIEYEWTESIPDYAFHHSGTYRSIESVVVRDGIKIIGDYSFYQCYSLSTIYLPASIEKIGENAFYHGNVYGNDYVGHGLKEIYYSGSAYEWSKIDKSGDDLNDVEIHFDQIMVQFVSNGGSSVLPMNITSGQIIIPPANPGRSGYVFDGWYSDPNFTIKYDFNTPVVSDLVLYAKWIKDSSDSQLKSLQLKYADSDVTIEWGEGLFNKTSKKYLPSTDFHSDLAYAALYLCDQAQISAKATENALNNLGLSDTPFKSEYYEDIYAYSIDKPAYSIGSYIFDAGDKALIAITIRGTRGDYLSVPDFMHKDTLGGLFNGFLAAGDNTYRALEDYISTYYPGKDKSDIVLLITGHSLGGATAGQIARMAINDGYSVNNTYVYTFAAPNYDTQGNNPLNYGCVFNVIHDMDVVPTVPWGYKRVGKDVYYGKIYSVLEYLWIGSNNTLNHHLTTTYLRCLKTGTVLNTICDGKHVAIHCPVDIEVVDKDNHVIARTKGEEIEYYGLGDIYVLIDGDKKEIYSVGDAEYSVKITGTDAGTMDYAIEYYDTDKDETKTLDEHPNINIYDGKTLKAEVNNTDVNESSLYITNSLGYATKRIEKDGSEVAVQVEDVLLSDMPDDGEISDGIWVAGVEDLKFTGKKLTQDFRVYDGTVMLTPKTDYTVSYKNNQKAYTIADPQNPTAADKKKAPQMIITMKGNYSGKQTVYFSITSTGKASESAKTEVYPITGDKIAITDTSGDVNLSAMYNKSGAKVSLRVMYEDTILKEGRDYTLKYAGNTKYPATKASVTVIGKGNYSQKKIIPLTITQRAFTESDGITVVATDKAEGKKAGQFNTTIKVYDSEGKLLKAGTDYEKNIVYLKDGVELTKTDFPKAGDIITAKVTGKGGYTNSSIETTYRIVSAGRVKDIGKATIKIKNQKYNAGNPVVISASDQFGQAFIGKSKTPITLSTDGGATGDFMVLPGSYTKNINKGTAKVTFMGVNGCTGTKTVSFKIGTRSLDEWWKGVVSSKKSEDPKSDEENGKTQVAYFSATGNTEPLAKYAAELLNADLYEIVPAEPYTEADLAAPPLIYEPFTNGQLGVLMPKGSEDLLDFVNEFLENEKSNARIDELSKKYIYQLIEEEQDNAA